MSKLLSISLTLSILFQSIGFCPNDMVKIDEFIEHAQFHSEQYGDNILVFIAKHYGELKATHEKEHQEEKKDHEQLPFQHQSHLSVVQILFYIQIKKNSRHLSFLNVRHITFIIKHLLPPYILRVYCSRQGIHK